METEVPLTSSVPLIFFLSLSFSYMIPPVTTFSGVNNSLVNYRSLHDLKSCPPNHQLDVVTLGSLVSLKCFTLRVKRFFFCPTEVTSQFTISLLVTFYG